MDGMYFHVPLTTALLVMDLNAGCQRCVVLY